VKVKRFKRKLKRKKILDLPLLFGTLTMSEKGEENELQKISCRVYG
jgi:hypothetical protein